MLDVVRLGGKAVGVHHGNLCAQVVAHLVELLALQVGSIQTVILYCNLLFLGATRSLVSAGLGNNFFNGEATIDYFGNTKDMVSTGAGNLVFLEAGLVLGPL